MDSFFFLLISEAHAVTRSQVVIPPPIPALSIVCLNVFQLFYPQKVLALGGNALLCHRMVPQESGGGGGRSHRNQFIAGVQVYNMLSVSGDAVLLEYEGEGQGLAEDTNKMAMMPNMVRRSSSASSSSSSNSQPSFGQAPIAQEN